MNRELSQSVASATQRLEQVSARLLEVAESLSESALPPSSVPPKQRQKNQLITQAQYSLLNNSNVSEVSMSSTAVANEDPRLAELVKNRLQVQLRRILAAQMAAASAAAEAAANDEDGLDDQQQRQQLEYYS